MAESIRFHLDENVNNAIAVDYAKLNSAFNNWAQEQPRPRGAAIAGDGKRLLVQVNGKASLTVH